MITVEEQLKKAILAKMRTIKKPPKPLSRYLYNTGVKVSCMHNGS